MTMEYVSSTTPNSSESFTDQHLRRRKTSFLPAQSEKIPPQMWTGFALSATWNEVIMLRDRASIRSIYSGTSQQEKMYYRRTLLGPLKRTQDLTCGWFFFFFICRSACTFHANQLIWLSWFLQTHGESFLHLTAPGADHEPGDCTFLLWTHG